MAKFAPVPGTDQIDIEDGDGLVTVGLDELRGFVDSLDATRPAPTNQEIEDLLRREVAYPEMGDRLAAVNALTNFLAHKVAGNLG